jgi:hypothetical protein
MDSYIWHFLENYVYKIPNPRPPRVRLCRKKWFGDRDGDCHISAAEFDELLGHSVAVTDAASSVLAVEMIAAYPDAKVVLNMRKDLDKWHESAVTNLVGVEKNWLIWLGSWFCCDLFWVWHFYYRFLWAGMFRGPRWTTDSGITVNGKWIYRGDSVLMSDSSGFR